MAMGKRKAKQEALWVNSNEIPKAASHPFYAKVNEVLERHKVDRRLEYLCRRFYKPVFGRPSMAPGVYFRLLLIGFFEGIDSERGIAWRVADSLSLREFLGFGVTEQTPDHSTASRTRRLLPVETHKAVFRWFVRVLGEEGLIEGQTIAIDATTLEASAAMRSMRRRDDGRRYEEYLRDLARAEGLENPTREQLARLDRKRKKKASNRDWMSPTDKDARIAKMKDGRTHMAHKAEHAVDLSSGAVVAVTLQAADLGDTTTLGETLREAQANAAMVNERGVEEAVADKGYHSQPGTGESTCGRCAQLHSGAGARTEEVERETERATAGVCESAAGERAAGQGSAETALGADGKKFCPHVRNRRHETNSPPEAQQHSQAASVPRRGLQPGSAGPRALRNRQTEDPAGDLRCHFARPDRLGCILRGLDGISRSP
jgi:transposase